LRTILYARVSTVEQTIAHQEAQARAAGFEIDEVVADDGVSGVSVPLAERPQGRRLFDMLRAGDVLVVRWIDRLGRNYADVTDNVRKLIARGVTIRTVINGLTFDGTATDPMQMAVRDAMLGFMAAMAQAQGEVTREAQRAGIAHARADQAKYRGRKPAYSREQLDTVLAQLASGVGLSEAGRAAGMSRQAVYRIREDMASAMAALKRWEKEPR
jgi:DNA invertase Pin-like site-specific DNA recombinase